MDKKNQDILDLDAIAEFAAAEIENADAQALLKDYRAANKSVPESLKSFREMILQTEKDFRQKKLLAAKEKYKNRTESLAASRLPTSATDRRSLFDRLLAKMPSIDPQFAFQFRNHESMNDEEILDILEQAEMLGFLDQIDE